MRIAIDATPLLMRSAGVKNYVYYWIRSLQELAGVRNVSAYPFVPLRELNHETSTMNYWQSLARLSFVVASNYSPLPLLNLTSFRTDIFHMSSILVRKPPTRARKTATLHDMTCWIMPELHLPSNVAAAKESADRVARRADGLIAVSEWTKQDAVRLLGLDPDRFSVIYPGVADAFFEVTAADIARVREQYQLTRPYVLFVGTIEPRKNLGRRLDAWEQLPRSVREEFELVLAGPEGWGNTNGVVARAAALAGVRYLRYVPEPDLAGLTAGATAFVYPSLYEGFGFPIAQAMAAGVPVLTSNVSSMPEVTGAAAVLVDPHSPGEISAGLEKLLTSVTLRERLAVEGRERAGLFRWEECARQSMAFFERVMGHI
jgi:glycosyltransferase involved in cell wall biosynthesis